MDAALVQPRIPAVPYTVREITARTALQKCTHPRIPWSLNPYQGCSHGCKFCYVPSLLHVPREQWGRYVLVKRNAPALLARELRDREPALVAVSTATDPYQAVEARCKVTRHCLEVLAKAQWPVSILSRSPLMLRDLELFRRFDDLQVGMSVPTLDDEARRWMEPGAPGIPSRLRCVRKLADAGLHTFVSLAPCYPLTGGVTPAAFAQALADAGVQEVMVGGYRHYGDSWQHMQRAFEASGIAGLGRFTDRDHIPGLIAVLHRELEARGINGPRGDAFDRASPDTGVAASGARVEDSVARSTLGRGALREAAR